MLKLQWEFHLRIILLEMLSLINYKIFYVKNISQVQKICFESDLGDGSSSIKQEVLDELKGWEVEIEQFAEDEEQKHIEDHENILARNMLNELM